MKIYIRTQIFYSYHTLVDKRRYYNLHVVRRFAGNLQSESDLYYTLVKQVKL